MKKINKFIVVTLYNVTNNGNIVTNNGNISDLTELILWIRNYTKLIVKQARLWTASLLMLYLKDKMVLERNG
ncbi:hypothetical protein GCM10023261_17120 [Bartonella jaculi]|uniref:Uncharacterized protein n=1 Tax=Bartonella jaculi TaxID=686226 RepID=A0ABP9NBS9_9HYPH